MAKSYLLFTKQHHAGGKQTGPATGPARMAMGSRTFGRAHFGSPKLIGAVIGSATCGSLPQPPHR